MTKPILFWLRRDMRLADHPGLTAVAETGRPVIPVFILDEVVETHGACPKWRLGLSVKNFIKDLERIGSGLVLRRGVALDVLRQLVEETGAEEVHWSRAYDPDAISRDMAVKSGLKEDGIKAVSHAGHLLFEPWTVETKSGGFFKVFTPMWNAVRGRDVPAACDPLKFLCAPEAWPASENLEDWDMGAGMRRGAQIVARHIRVGETKATERLHHFMDEIVGNYGTTRDLPAVDGTSRLSENLTYGEIGPRTCWHAGWAAMQDGKAGAETFLKELVWREFAYHLVYHTPQITSANWRSEWDAFPWNEGETPEVLAWKQGRTGVEFVDAAMREMYVTGTMHNRGRMIVASYLTKHLMSHWKIGLDWFADCLTDWDPASNAMGWQWSAGSGPDATPFFRIFNPDTQIEKFDKHGEYRARWLAETCSNPSQTALSYFDAIPESWSLSPKDSYPKPVVDLKEGRERALAAYKAR